MRSQTQTRDLQRVPCKVLLALTAALLLAITVGSVHATAAPTAAGGDCAG